MQLKIIRIENRIVTCEIDDGTIIDIARRWFTKVCGKPTPLGVGWIAQNKK